MQGPRTTFVNVSKASPIPTDGESLNDFADRLRHSLTAHMVKELKLKNQFDVFVSDIFADVAVVHVMQFKPSERPYRHLLSVPFQRNGDAFEFGAATPVKRMVTYVPVAKRERSYWG